jgi:Tfp pilus assembly PilM family ATPase
MSQSIGIHLGERRFHLIALEGGLKRHKVVCAVSGEIPSGEGAAQEVVERLREIAKKHRLSADSVYLAIDSGVAAFRNLTLPFDDREKIEEVIKFEVEGNLPQFDIGQVVIDFLVLSSKPGVESNLLVTAVPKERLRAALHLCERAGLEALDAELEGTALFDAAFESGLLEEDAGTVLIHVGDTSTTVVVADGRRLASLRAIRVGAAISRAPEEEAGESGKEDDPAAAPAALPPAAGTAERQAASVQRIRRELVRTLSGARTTNPIQNVYISGHDLAGLTGETLVDVTVQPLPFTLPGVELPREFVVAFGAALRGFEGGTLRPSLRREELRFSGRFERLELPLAVFSLLLFTLLFVQYIVLDKQLEWRDEGNLAKDPPIKGDMQFWLEASNQRMLPDSTSMRAARLADPPEVLKNYAAQAQAGLDLERTKFEELMRIRQLLKIEIERLSKELGQVSDIRQPQSALTATTLVMDLIANMGEDARIGIRRFEATYVDGSGNKEDSVTVSLDADFFGPDNLQATQLYNQLEKQIKAQPWCVRFEAKSNKELQNGKGIQADGINIQVNVDKAVVGGQP